ncbi:hypothetical protein L3N51_00825 [Metallosphaera sp. J1]|uniref:TIGR00304 family membrane protein n=1 Tax=Metallosphaera javensis (ex Hofmann et al. 2022) TaxID=99938 RepID=UPI001EDDA2D2|nr:DUF131 domain-containing protein [Metallosphaera javensis (ex Hofmann et al. 2022)]MCG3108543.1 hypothetical protein [Metallosphaera javensis (ex Hofmann et al. 2022)]
MNLVSLAFLLIFLGFILVFADVVLTMVRAVKQQGEESSEEQRKAEAGGVIFIGPIPIIFGTSKKIEKWMLIVALVITVILVVLFVLPFILGL